MKAKLKKAENKCLAKEKESGSREKFFQEKIDALEGKLKEQEDSHAAEVAELQEALATKVKVAKNFEGEVVEQYTEGFDEAIMQVKFLYSNLGVSPCDYFKEIHDGQLVDKPLLSDNAVEAEVENKMRSSEDIVNLVTRGEDQVDDSHTTN